MSDDRAKQMASLVRGLQDLDREKAEYMTEWKDRRVKLENALAAVSNDVLSGQAGLPLEPTVALPNSETSDHGRSAARQYPS